MISLIRRLTRVAALLVGLSLPAAAQAPGFDRGEAFHVQARIHRSAQPIRVNPWSGLSQRLEGN